MKFDQQTMATRFHELLAQRDAIREKSAPLRVERGRIEEEFDAEAAKIDAAVAEIEQALPPVKAEMAIISRALNGKTSLA